MSCLTKLLNANNKISLDLAPERMSLMMLDSIVRVLPEPALAIILVRGVFDDAAASWLESSDLSSIDILNCKYFVHILILIFLHVGDHAWDEENKSMSLKTLASRKLRISLYSPLYSKHVNLGVF